jgi:hypothetical protein
MYFKTVKDEWLTFLPCIYISSKCGSKTQKLTVTDNVVAINAADLDLGDVCMYEIQYSKPN